MFIKMIQLLLKNSRKAYLAAIGGKNRTDIFVNLEGDQVIPMFSGIVSTLLAGVKEEERQEAGEMLASEIRRIINEKEDAK